MKYSPAKFFLSYFLGKITITIAGAFLGSWLKPTFQVHYTPIEMMIVSIVLTTVITVVMFKVDVGKETAKIIKKLKGNKKQTSD